MVDHNKVNATLFFAGVAVNLICVFVYGNLFVKPREFSTNVASDLIAQVGRSPLLVLTFLVILPPYYAFRWTLGRFLIAAWNFRAWGIERVIGIWCLHLCILAILLISDFFVDGIRLTALLGFYLGISIVLAVIVRGWMRISAQVQVMSKGPTDDTVSAVIALEKKALPILLMVLEGPDNNARTAAAFAAGEIGIGARSIIDALKVASESTDTILREAAEAAVRRLTVPMAFG